MIDLTKYPKACKEIQDFYIKRIMKSTDEANIDEAYKTHIKDNVKFTDEQLKSVVEKSSRMILDVFDNNKIYIDIITPSYGKSTFKFSISVQSQEGSSNTSSDTEYKDRESAEFEAVQEAIKLLEKKL